MRDHTELQLSILDILIPLLESIKADENTVEILSEEALDKIMSIPEIANREKLDKLNKEYLDLILEELDETVAMAYVHGWRSNRHEKGKELREKIDSLKSKV